MGTVSYTQRGHPRKVGFLDGDLIQLAKIIKFGHSKSVSLPKEWLDIVDPDSKLEYLSINATANSIILRPYTGEVGK